MTEVLVLLLCIGEYACSDALKAYKAYNPEVRVMERKVRNIAYKHASKEAVVVMGTFYAAATERKLRIRLMQGLILSGNRNQIELGYRYEF
jgi:hypothetical protein